VVKLEIEQFIEQQRRPTGQAAFLMVFGRPQLLDGAAGIFVAGDEEIGAEKDVDLITVDIHAPFAKRERMEDEIEIAPVIVDLGHVHVIDCVVDG